MVFKIIFSFVSQRAESVFVKLTVCVCVQCFMRIGF